MTLKQKFNLLYRAGYYGPGLLVWLIGWWSIDLDAEELPGWRALLFIGCWFMFLIWLFSGRWILKKLFLKCPACQASIYYRAPDADGHSNKGSKCDNACHKCGQSFVD